VRDEEGVDVIVDSSDGAVGLPLATALTRSGHLGFVGSPVA
jgi:hypothetical protein